MTRYDTSTIHRYLDGVFAGVPLGPEVQDLKEEIRGNLAARVAELEASGADIASATRKAIKELGDVQEIIAQLGAEKRAPAGTRATALAAYSRNTVRPRPAFVVRTAVLSLAMVGGVVAFVFGLLGGDPAVEPWIGALAVALPLGLLVADSLRQETTSSHPLPAWRAIGYGLATGLIVGGVGLVGQYIPRSSEKWMLVVGIPLAVVAVVLYSYLGATQTNRMKAWAREVEEAWVTPSTTRLEDDPAAAARFGIYSGILWISAVGAFVGMSIWVGFAWSWLAFLAALLIQMAMVARMVFPDGMSKGARADLTT